jgi:hypothetical protein
MPELVASVVGRPLVEGSRLVGADVRLPRPGVGPLKCGNRPLSGA